MNIPLCGYVASGLCPLPSLCVLRGVSEVTWVPHAMAEWRALTWEESSTPALAGCSLLPEMHPGADRDVGTFAGGLAPPFSRPPCVEGLSLLQMLTPRGSPSPYCVQGVAEDQQVITGWARQISHVILRCVSSGSI